MLVRVATAILGWSTVVSSTTLFHHKARQASIVLNNVLYIDGGELSQWNGTGTGLWNTSVVTVSNITDTQSIDLTQSWSSSSIKSTSIIRLPSGGLQSQAFWSDLTGQTFYAYDGGVSLAQAPYALPPGNQLSQFNPSGQPDRWTKVSTSRNFSTLVRVQEGTYASGNGLGFALGGFEGYQSTWYDPSAVNATQSYVGGMIMYNMTSQLWYNVSAYGDYSGGSMNGAAHFAAPFGPAGILMLFGGASPQNRYLPLDRVTMYEPLTQTWAVQTVSGEIPPALKNACVVGTAGDNGTYEIFLYGGMQTDDTLQGFSTTDGAVYILTLPLFRWFKIPATVLGRYRHSCNIVGTRQMISVGGIVHNGSFADQIGQPDPWPQGLGIFDMTTLEWSTDYDSNAKSYTSPDIVKSYVQQHGKTLSTYDNTNVNSWFKTALIAPINTTSTSNSSTGNTSSGNTSTGNNSTTSNTTDNKTAGVSAGVIAGIVVAVCICIIMVAVLTLCIVRRRRSGFKKSPLSEQSEGFHDAIHLQEHKSPMVGELDNPANEVYYKKSNIELHSNAMPPEADGRHFYELEHPRHELP